MIKPQEKYDEVFNKTCFPARAEEMYDAVAETLTNIQVEYLNQMIEIVYCCGFTDGYDEGKFFYDRILR